MATTITRQNIEHLTAVELTAVRKAYAAMQAVSDNRGFNAIAGYHGIPLNLCYHHEDQSMFFPWHRGYLLTFEAALRDHDPSVALPYWDWTSDSSHSIGIPKAFTDRTQADGSKNPLLSSYINVPSANPPQKRWTRRNPGDPSELPTTADVENALNESDYLQFSIAVQDIHDGVHGWTGGDMGMVPVAAFDPVFFSHHCMIDRLWSRWQELYGVNNVPSSILNRPLRGFDNLTVASILSISNLGYSYASDEIVLHEST
jgi:tyrosinase